VISTAITTASCQAPFDLVLENRTVDSTVVCEAGTTIRAGDAFGVVSPGDLTLRAGQNVGLVTIFSVGSGGKLTIEIDLNLEP
jgi:hypothetical protein